MRLTGSRANIQTVYLTRVGLPIWGPVAQYTNGHVTSATLGNQAGWSQSILLIQYP